MIDWAVPPQKNGQIISHPAKIQNPWSGQGISRGWNFDQTKLTLIEETRSSIEIQVKSRTINYLTSYNDRKIVRRVIFRYIYDHVQVAYTRDQTWIRREKERNNWPVRLNLSKDSYPGSASLVIIRARRVFDQHTGFSLFLPFREIWPIRS